MKVLDRFELSDRNYLFAELQSAAFPLGYSTINGDREIRTLTLSVLGAVPLPDWSISPKNTDEESRTLNIVLLRHAPLPVGIRPHKKLNAASGSRTHKQTTDFESAPYANSGIAANKPSKGLEPS